MEATERFRIAAKRARERKEMRQEDVAAQLANFGVNITPNAYAKFEGGTRAGKFDEVAAIAQVLDIDLNAIASNSGVKVEEWLAANAENNFAIAEEELQDARESFENRARERRFTHDFLAALGGNSVEVRSTPDDFVQKVFGSAALNISDHLGDFFETLGDGGKATKALADFNMRLETARERRKANGRGLVVPTIDDSRLLWDRIAEALSVVLPNLHFRDE
jgi:transcriptional regulator with XRE-family HTH domain